MTDKEDNQPRDIPVGYVTVDECHRSTWVGIVAGLIVGVLMAIAIPAMLS